MTRSIAIDGPAGAGKSTIAKMIAKDRGYIYVDTGAMYRAIGLYVCRKGVSGTDEKKILEMLDDIDVSIDHNEEGQQVVRLNGEDVSSKIRTQEIGKYASDVSKIREVRAKMVALQQEMAKVRSVVMDGRDIGTVVLPDAILKIFLTASAKVRAQRRYDEYLAAGKPCISLPELQKEIEERDYNDSHRENSPLRQAEDAIFVDSSDLTADEVAALIEKLAAEKGL